MLNADINVEAIGTIFYEGTPLHDGAVVVRDARIKAAGCVLPLSANQDISKDMGTRHRAALGMSENSDALCVVVSEETGIISMAKNGVLIDLIGGAIPVFDRPQNPVGQHPVALKVQHRVHDMLHDLGARDGAVLVDMTHDKHRDRSMSWLLRRSCLSFVP